MDVYGTGELNFYLISYVKWYGGRVFLIIDIIYSFATHSSMLKIWPVLAVELDVEEMSKNHKAQRPVWFAFLLSTQMGKRASHALFY